VAIRRTSSGSSATRRHGPGPIQTFFNPGVDIVPALVEAFLRPREARLNTPASLESIMSGKKSVHKEYEVTIYLDAEVRQPFSVVLR